MAKLVRVKTPLLKKVVKMVANRRGEPNNDDEVSYPLLRTEMIVPPEEPVSTRDAVKIYRQHMLDTGYLEKRDLSDLAARFLDEIKEREQLLKDEVAWAKDTHRDAKKQAKAEGKRIKGLMRGSDRDDRQEYRRDLECLQVEIEDAARVLEEHLQSFKTFQKDKRDFVIEYVNEEIHGSGWRELLVG